MNDITKAFENDNALMDAMASLSSQYSTDYLGPFDNINIQGAKIDNLFIRMKQGKLDITTEAPYKIDGQILPKEVRNNLMNLKEFEPILIQNSKGGLEVASRQTEELLRIPTVNVLSEKEFNERKLASLNTIKDTKNIEEINEQLKKLELALTPSEKKSYEKIASDKMKELNQVHELQNTKGTNKELVTVDKTTKKEFATTVDTQKTEVKQKEKKEIKREKKIALNLGQGRSNRM